MNQWFCKRCRVARQAELKAGKPVIVRYRSGFVAVKLCCGHSDAISRDKLNKF